MAVEKKNGTEREEGAVAAGFGYMDSVILVD